MKHLPIRKFFVIFVKEITNRRTNACDYPTGTKISTAAEKKAPGSTIFFPKPAADLVYKKSGLDRLFSHMKLL